MKEDSKCVNPLLADVDTYSKEEYESIEKELQTNINSFIENIKNKYCVQPIFKIIGTDFIEVFLLNKAQHNIFKD